MRERENQHRTLQVTQEFSANKPLFTSTENGRLQTLDDTWDVANRWISQNTAMSLVIAATLGATWGWIQKRSR